jgi:hypothetical protein
VNKELFRNVLRLRAFRCKRPLVAPYGSSLLAVIIEIEWTQWRHA